MTGIEAKKLLKQNGINTKFIKAYMHGSSLRVRIMSKEISRERVEEILYPHQRVNRCEYTGDILSGGNFFIFVGYHYTIG
jgi:hypothetical protein